MHKSGCLICSAELVYSNNYPKEEPCELCGKKSLTNVKCAQGHFICDECHSRIPIEELVGIWNTIKTDNPVEVFQELLKIKSVHMHGPEHHFLVGISLLIACRNSGIKINIDAMLKIIERGGKVPGGICGNWGSCGAAISAGIFLSVLTDSSPLSIESWSKCNSLVSLCLKDISANGGPRCCKRNGYLAILAAQRFLKSEYEINLKFSSEIACHYSDLNKECKKTACPFYAK